MINSSIIDTLEKKCYEATIITKEENEKRVQQNKVKLEIGDHILVEVPADYYSTNTYRINEKKAQQPGKIYAVKGLFAQYIHDMITKRETLFGAKKSQPGLYKKVINFFKDYNQRKKEKTEQELKEILSIARNPRTPLEMRIDLQVTLRDRKGNFNEKVILQQNHAIKRELVNKGWDVISCYK